MLQFYPYLYKFLFPFQFILTPLEFVYPCQVLLTVFLRRPTTRIKVKATNQFKWVVPWTMKQNTFFPLKPIIPSVKGWLASKHVLIICLARCSTPSWEEVCWRSNANNQRQTVLDCAKLPLVALPHVAQGFILSRRRRTAPAEEPFPQKNRLCRRTAPAEEPPLPKC